MVGAGIYVLTGTVARDIAGPSIVISFILAAMVSTLAALCYAEFGTRVPKAGSAYIYTYVSIGEFWAFVIGWNILLEHMLGAASVARAWSGYIDSMVDGVIANATVSITGELHESLLSRYPDVLAFVVCIVYSVAMGWGVKTTAVINAGLTLVNIAVVLLVVSLGFWYANPRNWTVDSPGGFFPFGVGGVVAGAASCFYAFVGFDSIATSGEEAKNPSSSIPLATALSLGIVTIAYVLVSAALTLMVPYDTINPAAALSDAFGSLDIHWAKYAISIGALCGMTTTLMGSLYALPRCLYAMASDGLLFSFFGKVTDRAEIPTINIVMSGLCSALLALLFDLEKLVEFMSIGTLLAYTIVSASVIILRYRPPTVEESVTIEAGSGVGGQLAVDDTDDTLSTRTNSLASASISSDQIDIALAGKLRPQYNWLEPLVGGCRPGKAVTVSVLIYTGSCVGLCLQLEMYWGQWMADTFTIVLASVFIFLLGASECISSTYYCYCSGITQFDFFSQVLPYKWLTTRIHATCPSKFRSFRLFRRSAYCATSN